MEIHLLTIFPDIFDSYIQESIVKRALKKKAIKIRIHDIRAFSRDKHKKVDDRPYGGGPGMVLQVEPIVRTLRSITRKKMKGTKIILLSAKGTRYVQAKARALSKLSRLILISGHYEGVDERIKKYIDEEISIGDFVLTGGELGALVIVDSVTRLLKGVLGDAQSHVDESHEKPGVVEYPHYTRPEKFEGLRVPGVLLSGDHRRIQEWRESKKKHRA